MTHIHVFYTDAANGWRVMFRNAQGDQVGHCNYSYLKSDAVLDAKGRNVPVHILGKNGLIRRVI